MVDLYTSQDVEDVARWLAERINGGQFYDDNWYKEDQRELWRGHAKAMMDLLRGDVDYGHFAEKNTP